MHMTLTLFTFATTAMLLLFVIFKEMLLANSLSALKPFPRSVIWPSENSTTTGPGVKDTGWWEEIAKRVHSGGGRLGQRDDDGIGETLLFRTCTGSGRGSSDRWCCKNSRYSSSSIRRNSGAGISNVKHRRALYPLRIFIALQQINRISSRR